METSRYIYEYILLYMYIGRVVVTTYSIHNLPQAGCDEKEVIYIYSQVPRAGTIPMIPTERAPYSYGRVCEATRRRYWSTVR